MNVKPMLTLAAASFVWLPVVVMAEKLEVSQEKKSDAAKPAEITAGDVTVVYEVFSLETTKAAVLRRETPTDAELYAGLIARVDKGEVVQETLTALRATGGRKPSVESITQMQYPPVWEAAEIPETSANKGIDRIFAVPRALESDTRNLGLHLEMEADVSGHSPFINIKLTPDHTALVGRSRWGQDNWAVEMPEFMNQRISSEVRVTNGQPFLFGTLSPQQLKEEGPERVWLAFITPSVSPHPLPDLQKKEEGDPFVPDPNAEPVPAQPSVSCIYEAFSLPLKEAAELRRKTALGKDFHQELVARVAKGEAKQESFVVIRGNAATRILAGGGTEHRSPAAFDPVAFYNSEIAKSPPLDRRYPNVPASFVTRNCGTFADFSASVGSDNSWVELQAQVNHTTLGEPTTWGTGPAEIKLPTYHDQRITTSVFTPLGTPCFLGTMNPPDKLQGDAKPDKRVWFAFVTPDLAK